MVRRWTACLAFSLIAASSVRAQDAPTESAPAEQPAGAPAEASPPPVPSPASTPAAAASDATQLRARELFQQGVALSQAERWAEALARFRESSALVERPSTLLNIATALQRLGRPRDCIVAVDRYLVISDPAADADARARASTLRAAMVQSLAHVALAILPTDAELTIDGAVVPSTGEQQVELDPGSHAFVVQREGYLPARFALDLAPGSTATRAITLAVRPAEPALLEVTTQVVGGRIEVDGDVVGTDEVELELVPGVHVVRVQANGWQPFERTVQIEAGTRERIDAQLSRAGACQSVECEPAFWIVTGILVAGGAAAAIALPFALATEGPPYGGTANFHIDALRF